MKKKVLSSEERLVLRTSEIPLESSLGLLAYGDIAFTAWRALKKQSRKEDSNGEE